MDDNRAIVEYGVHFSYSKKTNYETLCQGDVLEKTDDLIDAMKEIHPYFCNESYKFFIVLTQSCDLVRRYGNKCKTNYITLAAVRDYNDFIRKELIDKHYAEKYKGFLLVEEKNKNKIEQLLERLYNNNESDYFFLYKDNSFGLSNSMVAYLKVSIALKSELHHEKCLSDKKIELSDEFKAKLGWLVGNMYSRVGTQDWESAGMEERKKELIDNDIYSNCIVGIKSKLTELKKEIATNDQEELTKEYIEKIISNIVVKTNYEKLMDIIDKNLQLEAKELNEEKRLRIMNGIKSSKWIKSILK